MNIIKLVLLTSVVLANTPNTSLAQANWRARLKQTVRDVRTPPKRGVWPSGQTIVEISGGATETWANGLIEARFDKIGHTMVFSLAPETMSRVRGGRLKIVILAPSSKVPVGGFEIRNTQGAVGLRNIGAANFMAQGVLYEAKSGVIKYQRDQSGVLRGAFDITVKAVVASKGKSINQVPDVRIKGKFAAILS